MSLVKSNTYFAELAKILPLSQKSNTLYGKKEIREKIILPKKKIKYIRNISNIKPLLKVHYITI